MRLPELPILEALPALKAALARGNGAVLAAPPGSGKTTVAPLALLDEPWLAGRKIILLEPRRLAARMAAARMASLLGERVGETVGYRIRFDRKVSAKTRIEVLTEGLLTRRLQSEPELPGVGLVICDEFHERSLDADLALALTLDARANLNPDLRVLVMSATLDTARVAQLLGGAPVVESAGRLFPVDIRYRPAAADDSPDLALAKGVLAALGETQGDILAFLPGAPEIHRAQRYLAERVGSEVELHPLFGDLPGAAQDAALQPARAGRRKVILATNIAQTSLTVEGVTTVVDSGLVRVARFDAGAGANRLETVRVSRASADQRSGRAGRLGPGAAYRLWSSEQHGRLPAHDTAEILAADLTRLALELAAWGARDTGGLALMDQPAPALWSFARESLAQLGAVDAQGRITGHGRELSRLPTAPRLGHMLLRARHEDLVPTAAWVAALLEQRSAGDSVDLAARVKGLRRDDADRARATADQFLRLLDLDTGGAVRDEALGRVVAWAYPERIARRREGKNGVYLCEDGGEARLPERDSLAREEWIAVAHWDPAPPRKIRLAAALDAGQVLHDHADRIEQVADIRWEARGESVLAEQQRRLGALVLGRQPLRGGEFSERIAAAMLEGVRALGVGALPWTDAARQWQARVLSLRRWRPEETWPDVSDEALAASLEVWLAPYLDGVTRREHLARLDLVEILESRFDHAWRRLLAKLAPTHIEVPTGSRITLEYFATGAPPALAVKLQELFGLARTPAVNDGRTPVAIHLLSPAKRPLAVTQDLAGFWARTYAEVRKEMKGRYPKHPWPEDPLTAPPTARAKPRR